MLRRKFMELLSQIHHVQTVMERLKSLAKKKEATHISDYPRICLTVAAERTRSKSRRAVIVQMTQILRRDS